MLTPTDILRLPYTPDLTQSGIEYACRSLNHVSGRAGSAPFSRLRRSVAGVAVELAFRRFLTEQAVPFKVRADTPFSEPDRYNVTLGGHRCEVKCYLITRRPQITAIRQDPTLLLGAPALIPADQFSTDSRSDTDLYLFAFLSGLVAAAQDDIRKAIQAGQPLCLVHALPPEWSHPQDWSPLDLVVKSDDEAPLELEVGGQDAGHEYLTERVTLAPQGRVELASPFHTVACLHIAQPLRGRLALFSAARGETYLVPPLDWGNIWVYGMEIWLAGYMPHEEFRRRASFVEQGSQVFQYRETHTRNLAVPIADLHPLGELIDLLRPSAGPPQASPFPTP